MDPSVKKALVSIAAAMLIVPSHMARTWHELRERQAQIEEGVARDIAAWAAGEPLRPLLVRHRQSGD